MGDAAKPEPSAFATALEAIGAAHAHQPHSTFQGYGFRIQGCSELAQLWTRGYLV